MKPLRSLPVFEALGPTGIALLLLLVAGVALALVAIGAGIGYQLTARPVGAGLGVLLGGGVATLLARDFLNWRLGGPALLAGTLFLALFALGQIVAD